MKIAFDEMMMMIFFDEFIDVITESNLYGIFHFNCSCRICPDYSIVILIAEFVGLIPFQLKLQNLYRLFHFHCDYRICTYHSITIVIAEYV